MAERLTEEQMDLLAVDVTHRADRWVRDRVLDLIAEVRERREQDRRKANSRFEDRYVIKQMFTATLERATVAEARIAELETALRECIESYDDWGVALANGAMLGRARAALAKGGSGV